VTQNPFDQVAEKFAHATDRALKHGYLRGELVLEMAARGIPKGSAILDYGCGPGRLSLLLARAGYRVRGVDMSAGMIREADKLERKGLDLEFRHIHTPEESLQAGAFDAILCSSVIEYVVDPDSLLKAFRQSLRDPGMLIISYANRSSLWRWYTDARNRRQDNPMWAPHNRVWTYRAFRGLLKRNGFEPVFGPKFFESPLDWKTWGHWFRDISLTGSLGLVAARPETSGPAR
jgi:2-polyprenyl-6-hydroxyphenyl methylase/3-demethylubiquinone-9 3-methyltransferase